MDRLKTIALFGLLGAAVLAGIFYFYNRGATPRLSGEITEVRTLAMERNASVALVNFRAENVSDRDVVVADREVEVVLPDGARYVGLLISSPDLKGLFDFFPILGGMKDEPLLPRREVPPGETIRGLVGARFDIPKHLLDGRERITLWIADGRGRGSELTQSSGD